MKTNNVLKERVIRRIDMGIEVYGANPLIMLCRPLEDVNEHAIAKMVEMEDILLQAKSKALTGNQIGWNKQVVVADYDEQIHFIINPKITIRYGRPQPTIEACLSIPDISGEVARHPAVHVEGYELIKKESYSIDKLDHTFVGLEAQMWEHECEHIKGMLFVDAIVGPEIRRSIQDKLEKIDSIRKAYLHE